MEPKDVTDQMSFENPDDELLPVTKCVCGAIFEPWSMMVSIYKDTPTECPYCHRKFVFQNIIRIYEIEK